MYFTRHFKNDLFGHRGHLKRFFILFGVGVLLFGISGNTWAQEETEEYVLEDTIVTATKMGETRAQETPMSMTVFSDELLKSNRAFKLTGLSQFVPNAQLLFYGPNFVANIRGIGSNQLHIGGEQSVALYIDGVYTGKGHDANADFLDVERIEVLRGPQGTLYGRNSTGGAVNIITKPPSDELELKIGLELGDYSKRRVDATISGPIVKDKMKARLTISDSQRDGYVDNLSGPALLDENFTAARGAVLFTPTDGVDIRLQAGYRKSNTHGFALKLMNDQGLMGMFGGMFGIPSDVLIPPDYWTVNNDVIPFENVESWRVLGNVTIDLPHEVVLRSITAYSNYKKSNITELDATIMDLMAVDQTSPESLDQFSQEFQLDGTWDRLKWLLGFSYYHFENDWVPPGNITKASFFGPGTEVWAIAYHDTDAVGIFGNVDYSITDKFSVEVGLRYSYEDQEMIYSQGANAPLPFWPPLNLDLSDNWDSLTPKFGVHYRATDDVFLFGTISKGFKSGALVPTNPPGFGLTVEPEEVWSYEIGLKTDWLDRRLRVNGTAFYYDYSDLQLTTFSGGWYYKSNATEATIKGFELELFARPIPALTVNASASYLDSEYDEYLAQGPTGPIDASGNPLNFAPEWKLIFGAQYVIPVGHYGFLTLRGDLTWTDDQYFSPIKEILAGQEAYTLLDALVRFETADGQWSLDFFAKNLTEEEYLSNAITFPGFPDIQGQIAAPRTLGVQLVFNY